MIPYYQGISESMKKACSEYGVQVYFKGGNTIKNLLMAPKDQDAIEKKSGVIYRYQCDRVECDEEYICESSRTFGERFKEHLKASSPIYDHQNITGHNVTLDNFSIVGREAQNLCRWIKEGLYIRVNNPSLNKNMGKYHLPHIWDEVLHNTSELKLKQIPYPSAPQGTTSTGREPHTLQWPFHLPLGNNISLIKMAIPSATGQ